MSTNRIRPVAAVVEHDPVVLAGLEAALEQEGFQVHVAGTGPEGAALLEEKQPDLVVVDLDLPSAAALLERLRAHEEAERIPRLVISSGRTWSRRSHPGTALLLRKPFGTADLRAAVRYLTCAPDAPARTVPP